MALGMALLAIVLTAFAGAPSDPKQRSGSEHQQEARNNSAYPSVPADGTIIQSNSTTELNKPCTSGQENRNSDLCAQWKAADAAEKSAYWAAGTFWISVAGWVLGAGTMIAAVAAALFARQAAIHTEAGAKEARRSADAAIISNTTAREIGEAQSVAYPYFKDLKAMGGKGDDDLEIRAKQSGIMFFALIENAGNSPVLNPIIYSRGRYYPWENYHLDDQREWDIRKFSDIAPHGGATFSFVHQFPVSIVPAIRDWKVEVEIELRMDFDDIFGNKRSMDAIYYLFGPDFSVPMMSTPHARAYQAQQA